MTFQPYKPLPLVEGVNYPVEYRVRSVGGYDPISEQGDPSSSLSPLFVVDGFYIKESGIDKTPCITSETFSSYEAAFRYIHEQE